MISAFGSGICFPPGVQVDRADDNAKYVGGNETNLCRPKADDTDNNAIDSRHDPTFPATPPDQNCGSDGQHARKIIKTKHV